MFIINENIYFLINLIIIQFVVKIFADECTFEHNKLSGTCVLASKCPHVDVDFRKGINPTICSFARNEPIVCCASDHQNERLVVASARKSSEYCTLYGAARVVQTQIRFARDAVGELPMEFSLIKNNESSFPVFGIVGGEVTEVNEYPHMVAIGWRREDNEVEWNCGGSLISQNFILTAGHCTSYRGISPSVIRIGEKHLHSGAAVNAAHPNEFRIARIINHPNYKSTQHYDDIALMKLDKDVTISRKVRPACLWQTHAINLTYSTVIGYGRTEFGGASSAYLLKADLEIFDNSECFKDYPKSKNLKEGVISTQICAGDRTGERDTCQGDSGGPLQTNFFRDGKMGYQIIGITSFGKACANTVPAVYTRVSSYLDWIESIVWP